MNQTVELIGWIILCITLLVGFFTFVGAIRMLWFLHKNEYRGYK